jgi:hypothetical protein
MRYRRRRLVARTMWWSRRSDWFAHKTAQTTINPPGARQAGTGESDPARLVRCGHRERKLAAVCPPSWARFFTPSILGVWLSCQDPSETHLVFRPQGLRIDIQRASKRPSVYVPHLAGPRK